MLKRKSTKFKFNPDNPIIYMEELDEHFDDENEFVCALDCHNTFTDTMGALSVISFDEIINIKFKVDRENSADKEHPLEFDKLFRIKNVYGRKLVKGQEETYILTRDGKITSFRSFKAINEEPKNIEKVHYFESFGSYETNYVVIRDSGMNVILEVYDGQLANVIQHHELMCSEDTLKVLQKENDVTKIASTVKFCVEYVSSVNEKAEEFFNAFLGCDLMNENISSILLASIDDRLLWIKPDDIDTKLISKGKILGMRSYNGGLMVIDQYWMLTNYYYCPESKIIKKNEIPLVGGVKCFRFHEDYLIYAAKYKMVIMKFPNPTLEPETSEISLGMVSSFTIVGDHDFLIAIDANKFFYLIPLMMSRYVYDKHDKNDFFELTQDQIIKLPESIKYLEKQEEELKALSEEFEREMDLKILLDHLEENHEFVGGSAKIKFLPCLMENDPNDIICNRTNSTNGGMIRISVILQSILKPFFFSIGFFRYTKKKGALVRDIDVDGKKQANFNIFVPCEVGDDPENEMELVIHFKTEEAVLEFPMTLDGVEKHEYYQDAKNDQMDEVIKTIEKLMEKNNFYDDFE